jgi:hypothetical protein
VNTPEGQVAIKRMIADDIAHAQETGNTKHAAVLKHVLKDYLKHHACAA